MQFRSIVSVFIVICLIIVALFGNVVESEKVLANRNQNKMYQNKNNLFSERLRRKVRDVQRRRLKRDPGDSDNPTFDSNSNPQENNQTPDGSYPSVQNQQETLPGGNGYPADSPTNNNNAGSYSTDDNNVGRIPMSDNNPTGDSTSLNNSPDSSQF